MSAILSGIVAFFGFFKWSSFVNWVLRGITFGKMLLVNGAITLTLLAYCKAVFEIIQFIYEKSNQFIKLVDNLTSGAGNEILIWAMDIFKALGVWNAFVDVYNIFFIPLASLVAIYAFKLLLKFLHSMQMTLISFNVARI